MSNIVFIATSIDGYIADRDNRLDWLNMVPNPNNEDAGFHDFIDRIDVIVMGRNTFETVLSFDGPWPYPKPVYVCSRTLKSVPEHLKDRVSIIEGTPQYITEHLHKKGFNNLYIDGGTLIQDFLYSDMIDELIITKIPILLGGGYPLFSKLPKHVEFNLKSTKTYLDQLVSLQYIRVKTKI